MAWRSVVSVVCFCVLFAQGSTTQQVKVHAWKPMQYPVMARLARVEGVVTITATLRKGEDWEYRVGTYEVQDGPPMLREASVENLKQQWFTCDNCKTLKGAKYEIAYEFRLDKDCLEEQQCFKRSSVFRSGHVLVEADIPMSNVDVLSVPNSKRPNPIN